MATYEQQMKNIRDSQQKALAGLFADISADDAQLKSIYEKWNAQGLSQQFGFSISGTQETQSSDTTVDCKSGVCHAPSTTVPQMAKWDATNGTWDFGTTTQSAICTREVSARQRTYSRSHRRDRDSSDSESESDWSGSDSDSGWSGSDSESDPYDSESVESGSESESE